MIFFRQHLVCGFMFCCAFNSYASAQDLPKKVNEPVENRLRELVATLLEIKAAEDLLRAQQEAYNKNMVHTIQPDSGSAQSYVYNDNNFQPQAPRKPAANRSRLTRTNNQRALENPFSSSRAIETIASMNQTSSPEKKMIPVKLVNQTIKRKLFLEPNGSCKSPNLKRKRDDEHDNDDANIFNNYKIARIK